MIVTVSLITYQHAAFIAQAIDSVLAQVTNFEWELLIGEDGSTDGTREIVQDYAARYPGRIRVFLNDRSNVIKINGRPTGRWNYLNNLRNARGKYVALLDGDDFWTDPHKLQKQVDLMEAHPEYALCGSDAVIWQGEQREIFSEVYIRETKPSYDLNDLLSGRFVPPTCTALFRRELLEFPSMFMTVMAGDMPTFIVCSRNGGKFGFLPDRTAVYRVHAGGIYTSGQLITAGGPRGRARIVTVEECRKALRREEEVIATFEEFQRYLGAEYRCVIGKRIAGMHMDAAWFARRAGDYSAMKRHAAKALACTVRSNRCALREQCCYEMARLLVLGLVPGLSAAWEKIRNRKSRTAAA